MLINGVSSKIGGGKSILLNLLHEIKINNSNNSSIIYYCLINDEFEPNITFKNIIFIKKNKFINVLFYYFFIINYILKKYDIKVILNLGDIPVVTNIKQLFLFDWAFAVYPKESIIWSRMNLKEYFTRKAKIFLFKNLSKYIDEFFVQTHLIGRKLNAIYSIKPSKCIYFPNAISFDHFTDFKVNIFDFKKKFTNKKIFLCLSAYYSHKNIEILIEVAKLLKKGNINFLVILTLPTSSRTRKLLDQITKFRLHDYIINIGQINSIDIPNLYKNVDALVLPTLLESFSGTYIEAMYAKIPIFTSNYDFAHEICQDSAIYFNPLDKDDILKKLFLINKPDFIYNKTALYVNILNNLYSWKDLYNIFTQRLIKQV